MERNRVIHNPDLWIKANEDLKNLLDEESSIGSKDLEKIGFIGGI